MGELVYVRYAINGNWANSSNALVSFTGAAGTATIPMQAAATSVSYYVFSTTVSNPAAANVDMSSIRFNNNGGSNYSYTVNTPLPPVNVTFQVDMSQVGGSAFISGSFNGWAQQAMTDAGGGIWTYTTSLNQGVSIQYKFRQGVNYEGDLLAPCGNGSNRVHTVDDEDEILDVVCYGSCSACPPPPVTVDVTFRVNMSQQTVSGNGVHIAGSFQGTWNPATIALTDGNNDQVYEVTLAIEENTSIQYKFINGNAWGTDESVAGACASGGNRVLAVGNTDMFTNIVCFGSCDNCPAAVPTHPVTFRLNMGTTVPSADGVHIAGNFGTAGYPNWVPDAIAMSDADGDFIYEVTLNLNENTYYDYKFVNGDEWGEDESSAALSGCEFSGNRTMQVLTSSVILPKVCYNSCNNCGGATPNDIPGANNPSLNATAYVYPNCYNIQGTTVGSTIGAYTGHRDVWYQFNAISNGISIRVNSSIIDAKIYLFRGDAPSSPQTEEDIHVGITGTEILNFGGLVAGERYYIAVAAMGGADGAFSLCIQQLRAPNCGLGGPYNLCSVFKSTATGATTTEFSFTDEDGYETFVVSSTGVISLSNPALGLLYGKSYGISLTANFELLDGAGNEETISVSRDACAITIAPHPKMAVKSNQRCSGGAVLYRSSYLQATPVGAGNICGVTGFRVEFTPVESCSDNDPIGISFTKVITSPSPYISLSYAFNQLTPLSSYSSIGYWSVRWRPIFGSYEGGEESYGNPYTIAVNGTAIAGMLTEEPIDEMNGLNNLGSSIEANIYPNPNNGEMVNINMTDISSDNVFVRIMDSMGRVVYTNRYTVDGSLNTIVSFSKPLATGLYMVEFTSGNEVVTQRMMVNK